MRESDLRPILLIKAIEEADGDAALLPPADRAAAAREARRELGASVEVRLEQGGLPPPAESLLARRAQILLSQLRVRHPFVQDVIDFAPGRWLAMASCIAAFALGAALSALDGSQRINVLAFPLWGVVLWNLLVYLVVIVGWVRAASSRKSARRWMPEWIAQSSMRRISTLVARARRFHAPLAQALGRFAADWQELARPILAARATAIFHVAAALLGAGLIAGFYVRGIALDYRAGWESTFLDAERARRVLGALYGPASALTGIALPDPAHLESIRWREGRGGEPAGPWIHLLAATTLIFVVAPRLFLALLAALAGAHASRRMRLPAAMAGYFDRTFSDAGVGLAGNATRIVPYACEPAGGALEALRAALAPSSVELRSPVAYGAEEQVTDALAASPPPAAAALLFTSAATPEEESHGRVIDIAREAIASLRIPLHVLVDEGPYASRMRGDLAVRVEERRRAWSRLVSAHGLEARFLDLRR